MSNDKMSGENYAIMIPHNVFCKYDGIWISCDSDSSFLEFKTWAESNIKQLFDREGIPYDIFIEYHPILGYQPNTLQHYYNQFKQQRP